MPQGFDLLPNGSVEVEPAFAFLTLEASFPAFVINNGTTAIVANGSSNTITSVILRCGSALPWDSQFDFDIPYRYRNPTTEVTQGAVGDVMDARDRIGLPAILLHQTLF